jgi:hypothetical protein
LSGKRLVVAVGAVALATSVVALPRPAGAEAGQALWSTSYASGQSAADCGRWRLDSNGFCVADDAHNGLEIGTRFTTSETVMITGVRIYRADPGTLRASLWTSAGTLVARGTFAPRADNGWQDLNFADAVRMEAGTTYIASYFTPATKYAFQYGYFKDAAWSVGPITALRSLGNRPNGVHCYQSATCSFPDRGYRDSTYWVSPLWTSFAGSPVPSSGGAKKGPPRVSATRPAAGANGVGPRGSIRVRFSEAVRPDTLTPGTVRLLRKGSGKRVPVDLRYDADRRRLVLDPQFALHRGATYRVLITTRIRDLSGKRLDQSPKRRGRQAATWTFRTRR